MLTLPMALDPHKLMKELFGALMKRNTSKVIELYKTDVQLDGNNLIKPYYQLEANHSNEYPLTTSHDTVLHIAMYSGQNELVKDLLLNIVSTNESNTLLSKVNDLGDTILHEATTTGKIDTEIISLILSKGPDELLKKRNNKGESPLFRAVHFGNKKMFEDLANRVDPHPEDHWNRTDGVNILHIAIHNEFFDLALDIARRYPGLLTLRNQVGVTALQLLSSMPLAFKSGCRHGWLRRFIYFCVPNLDDSQENNSKVPPRSIASGLRRINQHCWNRIFKGWLLVDEVWKEKERHELAFRLAKYLIIRDDSWKEAIDSGGQPPGSSVVAPERNSQKKRKYLFELRQAINMVRRHLDQKHSDTNLFGTDIISHTAALGGVNPTGSTELEPQSDLMDTSAFENSFPAPKIDTNTHKPETPLLVATKYGIEEIVEGILELYPQAIEHVSYTTGQNILHVAVMHRQRRIFDIVKNKEIPMKRLAQKIDNEGNTALHQLVENVGIYHELMQGPALQLQDELLWFKLVKDVLPSHFHMYLNAEGLNAWDFFVENHKKLLQQAQDWLKRTSQSCSVVAVLIATVAFAAAYTVPGGNHDSGDQSGLPILIGQSFFLVFTVMDVISLASSLTSVVMFLSILTSPFQFQDFEISLPRKLTLGFTFLFMSVATMMLAFAATIILTIRSEKYVSKILIYTVAFLPVSIFALLQLPLYLALTRTAQYSLIMLKKALPSCCIPPCLKAKISKKKQ